MKTHPGTWEYAVEQLSAAVQDATADQLALAAKIGLSIPPDSPEIVAAALLRVALFKELHLPSERPISDHLQSRLKNLRKEMKLKLAPTNDEEASAWVEYLRLLRRKRYLAKFQPAAGDVVKLPDGEKIEISSVGGDGRVYFKGGRGYRAWPDMVHSVVARAGANTPAAKKARMEAENAAAVRASSPEWSLHDRFSTFTTIPILNLEHLPETQYGVFLDPHTGIPLPDVSTKKVSIAYAPLTYMVGLNNQLKPNYMICFDQSIHRKHKSGLTAEQQREAKRNYLRTKGIASFYYISHAPFLFMA